MSSDRTGAPAWFLPPSARRLDFPFGGFANGAAGTGSSVGLPLTERELEVLKLVAEGFSTKEIAARLGISFKTAASHRMHIMQKLGIHETASLVRWAVRQKVIKA